MYKCLESDALLTFNGNHHPPYKRTICFAILYLTIFYLFYFNGEATANVTVDDLHHSHPNCQKEAEEGACKSDPVYMSIVCGKTFCDGK